ncbi:uncharacterized protein KY384_007154 [Bacidia gigantensis]|uniref:uncharacterized protein n=1 Tax=Bacidia gigantensis TaxID=2732470 RepID=UPI001D03CCB8|nr:uncharacterized protein KY384_007154 [Bacidia gigantensis]KAG8528237.1 hypothetical protein KY384_007154 [Bacidia gigantensis]
MNIHWNGDTRARNGQGGQNPALRVLYYRLLKLLGHAILPIFVFDGPYRPKFKRGVKISPAIAHLDNFQTKHLLKLFGFPFHDAPGEAEAECAALQKNGIVDAVFSEDVDTLMFGAGCTLRNWTAEGGRGNKSPTHIDIYRADEIQKKSGMDREGMILVALMSGGDYVQAGLPRCGPKIACQAARAGFGQDLCYIVAKGDSVALQRWRERLDHELSTNESRYFSRKNSAIRIPDSFPDQTILKYYRKPVISNIEKLQKMRDSIKWGVPMNVHGLRQFVAEAFSWTYRIGAIHFIRGLAPTLLVTKLVSRSLSEYTDRESLDTKAAHESEYIKTISGRRVHWMTDGETELRIAFLPADIVGLDLDKEEDVPQEIEGDEEEELLLEEAPEPDSGPQRAISPTKRPPKYDPTKMERVWVLETFVKLGTPLLVETWEEEMRDPKKYATRKARERRLDPVQHGNQQAVLDGFVKISKPIAKLAPDDGYPASTKGPYPSVGPSTSQAQRALAENSKRLGSKANQHISNEPKLAYEPNSRRSKKDRQNFLDDASHSVDLTQCSPNLTRNNALIEPQDEALRELPTSFVTQRSPTRRKKHNRSRSDSSAEKQKVGNATLESYEKMRSPSDDQTIDLNAQSQPQNQDPFQVATQSSKLLQTRTPESTPRHKKLQLSLDNYIQTGTKPTSPSINRNIDFRKPTPSIKSRPIHISLDSDCDSDSDALPSPSALLSPPLTQQESTTNAGVANDFAPRTNLAEGVISSVSEPPLLYTVVKKSKSSVIVRESLEGAWKCLDPAELEQARARNVLEDVEVVDLT